MDAWYWITLFVAGFFAYLVVEALLMGELMSLVAGEGGVQVSRREKPTKFWLHITIFAAFAAIGAGASFVQQMGAG